MSRAIYMLANFLILSNTLIFQFFFLDVCFEERYKNSVNKFDKMASGFVIASITLCPPSGLLEPPPGSRQNTPSPDEIMTFISIPIWLLNIGESSHFKWKSFAKAYGIVTWTLPARPTNPAGTGLVCLCTANSIVSIFVCYKISRDVKCQKPTTNDSNNTQTWC